MNNLILVPGIGSVANGTACLMSAARIFSGEAKPSDPRSDDCSYVCPSVRQIAIALNDLPCWNSKEERTAELLPLVPMLLDTISSDREVIRKRAYLCVDYAVRVFTPIALDRSGYAVQAEKLRKLLPIVDEKSAKLGESAAAYACSYSYYVGFGGSAQAAAYGVSNGASLRDIAARAGRAAREAEVSYYSSSFNAPKKLEPVRPRLIELLTKLCDK